MAGNEIRVTVTGDDELSGVVSKATSNAEADLKGLASSASGSAAKMGRDFDGAFDKLGEGSGGAEQKFIGLKDSITGTQDVMAGLRNGDVVTLAAGLGDLAGAAEMLWASVGKVVVKLGQKAAAMATDVAQTIASTAATVAHTVASIAAEAAAKAWAAAQWLLNAAMSANPIGLVVVAIVALVAAFVLAWQHSETFRQIVTGAFDAVLGVASAVFGWIRDNWPLLLAILTGPFGLAVLFITRNWDEIKNGATDAVQWVVDRFVDLTDFVTSIPGRITDAVGDVGRLLYDIGSSILSSLWNGMVDKWNEVAGWVGGIGGKIKGLKGPIETDRTLLQPEGAAIMQGLQMGLESGWSSIAAYMGSRTGAITNLADAWSTGLQRNGWASGGFTDWQVSANRNSQAAQGRGYNPATDVLFEDGSWMPRGGTAGGGRAMGSPVQIIVQSLDSRSAEEGVARALEGARRRGLI
jgi:phage-related protein